MDETTAELNSLVEDEISEIEYEEQRRLVRESLQSDFYEPEQKPPSPCEATHIYENPAITQYCEMLNWDDGWTPVDETEVLLSYPEYLPTDEAIETITDYGPILEIGAGNGYWAYVLAAAGCEIIPTDMLPRDVETPEDDSFWESVGTGKNNFIELPRSGPKSINNAKRKDGVPSDKYPNTPWCEVKIADHSVVKEYPKHTILSCHPELMPWTEEMLEFIQSGQTFIFVGEWYPGSDAMPFFFKELLDWELLDTFPVYDWRSMHAHGYVFQKP